MAFREEALPLRGGPPAAPAPPPQRRRWPALLAAAGLGALALGGGVRRTTSETLATTSGLRLSVANEYGECTTDRYPFLHGITTAVLVEPHKSTRLAVAHPQPGATYRWHFPDAATVEGETVATAVRATWKRTGVHKLVVSGPVDRAFDVYVKYVRREIRRLTDRDRRAFLEASKVVWTTSTVDGRKLYGPRYKDINHLTIIHNDLAGNSICDFIHGNTGYAFANAHAALNNMREPASRGDVREMSTGETTDDRHRRASQARAVAPGHRPGHRAALLGLLPRLLGAGRLAGRRRDLLERVGPPPALGLGDLVRQVLW